MFDKENGINLKTTLDLKLEDCFFCMLLNVDRNNWINMDILNLLKN